ncbi:uncharacterized protein LOC113642534 [Tachysurus ichikawai]
MNMLNAIDDLEQSRFGRPHPRHGLKLLYWFATDCLTFDQNNVMQSCCDPQNGHFGFHIFENRYEKNFGKLLPNVALPYYEVGNLSKAAAYSLPCYIREDYTSLPDDSNMDRIIVSFNKNDNSFDRVFVTQHRDLSNFNKHFTYNISKSLIMMIRNLTLEEFLLKTGYSKQQPNRFPCSCSEELNKREPPCPALTITSICSPLQDVCPETKSPRNLMMNNTVEHHKTPPETSICIAASTSSTNQDIYSETESTSNLMNNTQRHHEASLTSSMCSPANTISTTQDIHWEVKSPNLMNNNTQGHHEAPPTPSFYSPAHTSSMTQDIPMEVESPEILVKNHTQGHHEAPPTHYICTPATSTTPNVHTETESPPVFTNTNTQIHTNGEDTFELHSVELELEAVGKQIRDLQSHAPRKRPAQAVFTPAPGNRGPWVQQRKTRAAPRARTSPPPPPPVFEIPTQNRFAPIGETDRDAVIIGDSIVRHVRVTVAKETRLDQTLLTSQSLNAWHFWRQGGGLGKPDLETAGEGHYVVTTPET